MTYGDQYYEEEKRTSNYGEPYSVDKEFIIKNKKLISQVVYYYISPKYYHVQERKKDTAYPHLALLRDKRITDALEKTKAKLSQEGVTVAAP